MTRSVSCTLRYDFALHYGDIDIYLVICVGNLMMSGCVTSTDFDFHVKYFSQFATVKLSALSIGFTRLNVSKPSLNSHDLQRH
jgi:hypothetical protein